MDIDVIVERKSFDMELEVGNPVVEVKAPDHYNGPFDIFPSDEDQIIPVKEKMPVEDICVKGITGEKTITENGTYNTLEDKAVDVDVQPDLRPLSASENGTYEPEGFDGYDEVTVDVPQIITPVTMCQKTQPSGDMVISGDVVNIPEYIFYKYTGITSVLSHNTGIIEQHAFSNCSALESVHFTSASQINANSFRNNSQIVVGVFENAKMNNGAQYCFGYCPKLKKLDFGENLNVIAAAAFEGSSQFDTLILRASTPCNFYRLGNAWHPFGSTLFKQGGSGGTLYIPKALYDHLGDGSEFDFLADSSWNQILSSSWGNNQVLPIEGSPYEHYYADGTPIS